MMTELTLINELGSDADLLMRPDDWLENRRLELATSVSMIVEELEGVLKAQRFKQELQQTNRVAVMLSERDDQNRRKDIAIKVMPIRDAIALLSHPRDDPDRVAMTAQVAIWRNDGYDINESAALRQLL